MINQLLYKLTVIPTSPVMTVVFEDSSQVFLQATADRVIEPSPLGRLLAGLNAEQRAAVEYGLSAEGESDPQAAALLVIAGAGTGKTQTLASRVARLMLAGVDPERLLLLTFSRRAAQEMQRRAGQMLATVLQRPAEQRPPRLSWAGTFHSVAARLLRDHAPSLDLAENFSVHDRGDSEDLMAMVRQEAQLGEQRKRFPLKGTCLAIYSRCVNSQTPLEAVLNEHYPWCAEWHDELRKLFAAYVEAKQQQAILDYDDLLLYWSFAMADETLAREIGARFDHVLVDEYQDTNRLQAAILKALKPDGRGLTVVGDDAQSIYSFRAAEVRNILDFPVQFEPPAQRVTLEQNYRSTQPILDASNALMRGAREGHAKSLRSERLSTHRPKLVFVQDDGAQARWVADQVLAQREAGVNLKSQAVLFRTSHHSAAVELELTRRNIPFVKFGGLKFLEAAHVKDLLSVLRWAENPGNRIAGFRAAQLVPGFGPASARRLFESGEVSASQRLARFKPPSSAAGDWPGFVELMATLESASSAWPDEVAHIAQWYAPHLALRHDDAAQRQADLQQLAIIARSYPSRERFLTELTLDPPDATSDEAGPPHLDEDYLILSTIHSAKGQEWRAVYLLNVVDGCIPSDLSTGSGAQIDEERRLLYVAMTRARDELQLLVPQRFYVSQQSGFGDRHVYGNVSRFVTAEVRACLEVVAPTATTMDGLRAPVRAPVIDVGARARAQWR